MTFRALISVADKSGIEDVARAIVQAGGSIISTGGTARALAAAGIDVTQVEDVTGQPELLDGRVKTLHPRVHAALLADIANGDHCAALREANIDPIQLLIVNLYAFEQTIARPGVTVEEAVEQIDIGGPAMLRAAAKNHSNVLAIVDPDDYERLTSDIRSGCLPDESFRRSCAIKAFAHTASYDAAICDWLWHQHGEEQFPSRLVVSFDKRSDLRYGENPHQAAAFYVPHSRPTVGSISSACQLNGKELSYNNIVDADAACAVASEFEQPVAVVVKHANPCAVAVGDGPADAFGHARDADSVSAFGGIVAFNRPVDLKTAVLLNELFLEIVIAPDFSADAIHELQRKPALRVLQIPAFRTSSSLTHVRGRTLAAVGGGLLVQERDEVALPLSCDLEVVTATAPDAAQLGEALFAWRVVKHVKSNAIVVTRDGVTRGIGAGQMNRVGAVEIALRSARDTSSGAVLASDAFFPMPDSIERAAEAGIATIIQPGGSRRDADVIAAADEAGMAMVFTGKRHFRH